MKKFNIFLKEAATEDFRTEFNKIFSHALQIFHLLPDYFFNFQQRGLKDEIASLGRYRAWFDISNNEDFLRIFFRINFEITQLAQSNDNWHPGKTTNDHIKVLLNQFNQEFYDFLERESYKLRTWGHGDSG